MSSGHQELGIAAAQLLDKVEQVYGEDAVIRDALVLAEVGFTDEDGEDCSAVEWFCTSERSVVREGLLAIGNKASPFTADLEGEG